MLRDFSEDKKIPRGLPEIDLGPLLEGEKARRARIEGYAVKGLEKSLEGAKASLRMEFEILRDEQETFLKNMKRRIDEYRTHTYLLGGYSPIANGMQGNVSEKDSDYTIETESVILADASSGDMTVTLPTAGKNRMIHIKKVDTTANIVTVSPPSGTIDGETGFSIEGAYDSIKVTSDGTNWFIL